MSNLSYQKNFSYFAPAKINLCLKIGKKRPCGYHELASVVGFTEFGDAINIQLSNLDELILSGRFSADIETKSSNNLVMKSLNALRNLNHYIPPLKITIDKQIPVGGGLGGGSSDAATVFLALNKIFDLNISKKNLTEIALRIGADVPVCLYRNFMLMGGIGEQVYPIFELDSDRASAGNTIGKLVSKWNNTEVASIQFVSGDDTSNKDNASIYLNTRSGGSGNVLRLRCIRFCR